jgi:hypothetical protein
MTLASEIVRIRDSVGRWVILAAAHEADYFKLISILERCGLPLCAGDDLQIEFDRQSVRFHAEMLDECGHR